MSVKYKLLLLLVILPTTMLSIYLVLAMSIFKSDKIAYIYDSSTAVSKTLSNQARAELESLFISIKPVSENTNTTKQFFKENESVLYFAEFNQVDKNFIKSPEFSKGQNRFNIDKYSIALIRKADKDGMAMMRLGQKTDLLFIAKKLAPGSFYVAVFDASDLLKAFERPSSYSSFLVNASGEVLAGPKFESRTIFSFSRWPFFKKIKEKALPSMTSEIESSKTHKTLLLSYNLVGEGGLSVISLTDKTLALQAVDILLWKSILFFIALISFATLISVFASRKVTRSIRELSKATKEVAEGQFDVSIEVTSNDEIGTLAENFNHMAVELRGAHERLQDYAKNLEVKVTERTKELAETNQSLDAMVNSLGQGFLLFDHKGLCAPLFSKASLKLLEGDPTGRSIWDVLKIPPEKSGDFKNWCVMLFQEMLPFPDMIQIAPKTFNHSANRHVTLEYFPIRNSEQKLSAVVLVATDKTEELEAITVAKREVAFAKRVMRISKNREQFRTFSEEAFKLFDQVKELLSTSEPSKETVESIFQLIHTLKGDSGTFMLDFLFEKAHLFEEKIQELKTSSDEEKKSVFPQLIVSLEEMRLGFEEFLVKNENLVGKRNEKKQFLIPEESLSSFFGVLKQQSKYQEVAKSFQYEFLKESISKFFMHFSDLASDVAERRNKKIKPLIFKGGDLRIDSQPYLNLFATFVHAVRNSIDHGIETPEERTGSKKEPEGSIFIEFKKRDVQGSPWIDIIFKDDGRGIDPKIIRQKTIEKGFAKASDEDDKTVIQHIFDSGFSTRETADTLSGRGVGMGAIKAAAESLGGTAFMESQVGQGSTLLVSVPEIDEARQSEDSKSA